MPAGGSAYHTCRYVYQDLNRVRLMYSQGVREHHYRLMAEDFEHQHQLHPQVEKAVFHSVLSFPPGENPDDRLIVELETDDGYVGLGECNAGAAREARLRECIPQILG